MDEKEKEVYEMLLEKIKGESDPDQCYTWTCTLDRFCNAIRTKAGG